MAQSKTVKLHINVEMDIDVQAWNGYTDEQVVFSTEKHAQEDFIEFLYECLDTITNRKVQVTLRKDESK